LYTAALALQTFERQEIGPSGFRGKLILTASVFAYYPSRAMPLYAASKAGIINFMRSAAQYYATKNITVNAGAQFLHSITFPSHSEKYVVKLHRI
jgi:NAD(P)-dependent dehydrogenase (short-subunit alcohol dehydrogenase family)